MYSFSDGAYDMEGNEVGYSSGYACSWEGNKLTLTDEDGYEDMYYKKWYCFTKKGIKMKK